MAVIRGIFALVLAAAALPQARAYTTIINNQITGVVVEEGTGKPIANAIVTAKWFGGWSSVAGGGTVCLKGVAVEADAVGRFQLAPWTDRHTDLDAFVPELIPYKPGFADADRGHAIGVRKKILGVFPADEFTIPATQVRVEMRAFAADDKKRAEYLERFLGSTACRESGDVQGMKTFYRAVRAEVAQLPAEIRDYKARPSQWSLLEIIDRAYLARMVDAEK